MIEKLEEILAPLLAEHAADLVDIQIKGRQGNQTVKVFIDCQGGTTLDKCEKISKEFSDRLDIEDIIDGKYRLEVSSPGLDRPLRSAKDFRRHLNREVAVVYEDEVGPRSIQGKIVRVSGVEIQIKSKQDCLTIPISQIKHGKLNLPW